MNRKIKTCTEKLWRRESRGCMGSAVESKLPSLGGTKNEFCWIFMISEMPGQPVLEPDLLSVSWEEEKLGGICWNQRVAAVLFLFLSQGSSLEGGLFFLRARNLILFSVW